MILDSLQTTSNLFSVLSSYHSISINKKFVFIGKKFQAVTNLKSIKI